MKRITALCAATAATVVILPATILGMAKGGHGPTTIKTAAVDAPPVDARRSPPGVAAVVNDQTIPVSKVSDIAVRVQGASILDQLVGDTLIHQEARRRNITVTAEEVDARIGKIQAMVQPKSLDDILKARRMGMEDFRSEMQSGIEVKKLVADRLKPVRMAHVRDIFVNISPFAGMSPNLHNAAQADRIMATVAQKLKAGALFDELAKQYGDDNIDGKDGGDLGIVTNFPNADRNSIARGFSGQPAFLKACLSLKKREVVGPVRTRFGLHMIQAVSTGDDPLPSEEPLYADARDQAIDDQISRLAPELVESLKRAGKVSIYLGAQKPGPAGVAAVVRGETIPASHVVDIALSTAGPMVAEGLISNALVDQEAIQRHITVTSAQVDTKIGELRQQVKPRTLEDVLRNGHMTMAELQESQKVKIETEEMIAQNIGQFRAAHVRDISILIKHDAHMTVGHSKAEAKSMMAKLMSRLKSGAKFDDIARQYSEDFGSKTRGGDLGIVTEKDAYEPAFLKTALLLRKGQIANRPIETSSELHLLQAVSTSVDHPAAEDALYRQAQQNAKMREIQTQAPVFLRSLRSRAKVVDYLASA